MHGGNMIEKGFDYLRQLKANAVTWILVSAPQGCYAEPGQIVYVWRPGQRLGRGRVSVSRAVWMASGCTQL